VAVELEVLRDARHQALGQRVRARRVRAAADDEREFVAAQARQKRPFGGGAEPAGDRAQELVADRMAEDVVDLLEAVDGRATRARMTPFPLRRARASSRSIR